MSVTAQQIKQARQSPAIQKLLRSYSVFKKAYRNDPVAFIHDCIEFRDEKPTPYQDEILSKIIEERRVSVRGPHGLGKTAMAAWVVLWFSLTRDGGDWKCPTTASAWRQLTKFLWPEIHKWSRRVKWGKVGRDAFDENKELLAQSIKLGTGEAFAISSDKSDLIEGAHAEELFYLFDESKSIPDSVWDAAEGAFASGTCFALAISTPGPAMGRFYDIHSRKRGYLDWWVRKVTKEEAIAAGRISKQWVEERRQQWGEGSPVFTAKVEGDFPKQTEDQLISMQWVEAARERSLEPSHEEVAGQDVARFGDDDSVYIKRAGRVVTKVRVIHGQDTHEIASFISTEKVHTNVDGIGVGAGVCDNLSAWGCSYNDIVVSESPLNPDHSPPVANKKAEYYWHLRSIFKDGEIDLSQIEQHHYDRLMGELVSIRTDFRNGKVYIKSKEEMRKELRKHNPTATSPDMAEALMLCFAPVGATNLSDYLSDNEDVSYDVSLGEF